MCVCEKVDRETHTKGEKRREIPEYLKVEVPAFWTTSGAIASVLYSLCV